MPLLKINDILSLGRTGSIDDMFLAEFKARGYTGTVDDMFRQYLIDNNIAGSVADGLHAPLSSSGALAVGLGFASQYDDDKAFINIAKHMVPWKKDSNSEDLDSGDLDSNGYPNKMPVGETEVYTTFSITDGADPTLQGQRVVITWDGDGVLAPEVSLTYASGESYSQGRIVVTPGSGANRLTMTSFGTTGVTNLVVVRETHESLYNQGEIYNPDWLELLTNVHSVRFLNWSMYNNDLTLYTPSNRPKLTSFSWRFAVPWEACIALANKLNSNPWLVVPTRFTQEYIEEIAALTRDELDESLTATVELSNETWNSAFTQFHHFNGKSAYLWGTTLAGTVSVNEGGRIVTGVGTDFTAIDFNDGATYCFVVNDENMYGVAPSGLVVNSATQLTLPAYKPANEELLNASIYRLASASGPGVHNATSHDTLLIRQWWDAIHPDRTDFVLSGQSSSTGVLDERLSPSIWSSASNSGQGPNNNALTYANPSTFIEAISTAPYFASDLTSGTEHDAVIAAYGTGTPEEIEAAALLTEQYFRTGLSNSLDALIVKMREAKAQADNAGVELRFYEAGCHHISGSLDVASRDPFADIWLEWVSTYGENFFNDYFEAQASFASGGVMQFVISNNWSTTAVWGAYPDNYYVGDGRTDSMNSWRVKPKFWLSTTTPIATGDLPNIEASEFESISINTDVCFSSNVTTYSSSNLPDGLTINSSTGLISGTITEGASGTGTYNIIGSTSTGLSLNRSASFNISAAPAVDFDTKTGGVFHFDSTVGVTGGGAGNPDNVTGWASGFGAVALSMVNTAYPVTNTYTINSINSLRLPASSPIQFRGPDITSSFGDDATLYAVIDITDAVVTTNRVIMGLFGDNQCTLFIKPDDGTVNFYYTAGGGLRTIAITAGTSNPTLIIGARVDGTTGGRLVVNGVEATNAAAGTLAKGAGLLTVGGSQSGFNPAQLVRYGMLWAGAVSDNNTVMDTTLAAMSSRWSS